MGNDDPRIGRSRLHGVSSDAKVAVSYGLISVRESNYTGGQLLIAGPRLVWYPFISELTGQGPIGGVDAAFETQVAATPLPPAWTMMLIGLAGFGFVAYRRKSKPALVAT
jgi:hypothetical protein